MSTLKVYHKSERARYTEAHRVSKLLGLKKTSKAFEDGELANRVIKGLPVASAEALGKIVGRKNIVGPVISAETLRRAKENGKTLSREMSERLYAVGRVIDIVGRTYCGDREKMMSFLNQPHKLLDDRTPLRMAQMGWAGSNAVVKLLQRANAGLPV